MTKTALVTGSSGFLGRHFSAELQRRGYEVQGFDLNCTAVGYDLANYEYDALDFFAECTTVFDLVVPAAYHVGGRAAIDGTNTNFAKNLQLDSALFEWAVRTKQRRVLYFSSSAAYPIGLQRQDCHRALKEVDCPVMGGGQDFGWMPDANYGWAKLTGERLAADARRNGLRVSVVRPFSGYGEDQSLDYPFPSIVSRAKQGDLSVWGPPGQSRDWIHVEDVVKGALAVVESETTDPVNLCTGVATEMGDLAAMVHQMIPDHQPTVVQYDESKPTGVFWRVGDSTRMLQYYTPKVSLEEGIRRALSA